MSRRAALVAKIADALQYRLARGWAGRVAREAVMLHPYVYGPAGRVHLGEGVVLCDAILNVVSGTITIGDYSFCGHGVAMLTGTHDARALGRERQHAMPHSGHDIVIGQGVWMASGVTIVGPCVIGATLSSPLAQS